MAEACLSMPRCRSPERTSGTLRTRGVLGVTRSSSARCCKVRSGPVKSIGGEFLAAREAPSVELISTVGLVSQILSHLMSKWDFDFRHGNLGLTPKKLGSNAAFVAADVAKKGISRRGLRSPLMPFEVGRHWATVLVDEYNRGYPRLFESP